MFGTFVAVTLLLWNVPAVLAIPLALLFGAALGVLVERVAYRPLRGAHRMVPTVSAIGAALILRNTAQLIWGTFTVPFPITIELPIYRVFGIGISGVQIVVFAVTVALMAIFHWFVSRTLTGKAMRAVQQDADAAGYMGIPVNRIITMVYALGAALGVAGGILFAVNYNTVFVLMGFTGTLKGFTAAVIGGIGNLQGAFLGGLLLGVIEALTAGYISSGYRDAIAFAVLIVILLVRPQGLLGTQRVNKV
jgi:branched-chain amino acid transport system permease protein